MKDILKVVLSIIIFFALFHAFKFGVKEYRKYSKNQETEKIISKVISQLNKQLPKQIDDNTTITEVTLDGRVIEYKVSVGWFDFETINADKLQKSQKITNIIFVCNDNDAKKFISRNYEVRYSYSSLKGAQLFSNQISRKDCSSFYSTDRNVVVDYFVSLQRDLLPFELDAETIWVDVRRENNTVELKYRLVSYSKFELDIDAFHKAASEEYAKVSCSAPDLKVLFDRGFETNTSFVDKNDELITSLVLSKQICGQL